MGVEKRKKSCGRRGKKEIRKAGWLRQKRRRGFEKNFKSRWRPPAPSPSVPPTFFISFFKNTFSSCIFTIFASPAFKCFLGGASYSFGLTSPSSRAINKIRQLKIRLNRRVKKEERHSRVGSPRKIEWFLKKKTPLPTPSKGRSFLRLSPNMRG